MALTDAQQNQALVLAQQLVKELTGPTAATSLIAKVQAWQNVRHYSTDPTGADVIAQFNAQFKGTGVTISQTQVLQQSPGNYLVLISVNMPVVT